MAQTIKLRRSATPSAVPTTAQLALGELAINTYDGKLYMKKNVSGVETIVDITSGTTGGASVTVSTTAPASPTAGDLWFDSTYGKLKVYYNDGTSSQWVDAFVGTVGPQGPAGATGATGAAGTIDGTTLSTLTGMLYANGSNVTAYSAPTAAAWIEGFTTTATAGGTTTLTNTSSVYQIFTGSSAQTIQLPATSTLTQGWSFHLVNNSTGTLTVQTSTSVSLGTIPPGVTMMPTALTTTGNTASDWETGYTDFSTLTGTGANVLAIAPTLTGTVLAAGTTTVAPLDFAAGANLTTPIAGGVEYDGTAFYLTPFGTSRSANLQEQLVVLGSTNTLTSQTAAQPLFDNATANGAVSLAVGTYQFECFYSLSAMSGNNSFGFALAAGTAVISAQYWTATANKAALATATAATVSFNTAANTALTASNTTTTGYAFIKGMIRISTAGTIVPQVSLGGAAAAVVGAGSYFKISPMSPTSAAATNITVGNWS